jgi:acyl carrier protein
MSNINRLQETFASALNIPLEKVDGNLVYQAVPEWDSISHLMLISELEESFGVSISTEDIPEINSVDAARAVLEKYNVSFNN